MELEVEAHEYEDDLIFGLQSIAKGSHEQSDALISGIYVPGFLVDNLKFCVPILLFSPKKVEIDQK